MKTSIYIIAVLSILISSCGTFRNGRLKYNRISKSEAAHRQSNNEPSEITLAHEYLSDQTLDQAEITDQEEILGFDGTAISEDKQHFIASAIQKKQTQVLQEIERSTHKESADPTDEQKPDEKLARAAGIMGGLSFIPVIGWVFSILAITFGTIALKRINENPEQYGGRKHAILGRVLGIVTLCVGAVLVLVSIAALSI